MKKLFLGLGILCVWTAAAAQQSSPDVILFHGKMFTSVASHPYVEALAIQGDRIVATAMLQESLKNNDQLLLHVSGNLSAETILDAIDASGGKSVWNGRRLRFEHGDGIFPDQFARIQQDGIVVVQNPIHFAPIVPPGVVAFKKAQPLKSLLAAGIPLALGSDGPINPYFDILFATNPGNRPSEAITREQAVTAYTLTSAYAEFQEKEKGTIEPGKLADSAVLSQDIFTVPTPELPKTVSVLTMVGGKVVYRATDSNIH